MQALFHEIPNRQWITNGHSCMVRIHTKPEYQMMTPDNKIHDRYRLPSRADNPFPVDYAPEMDTTDPLDP